MPQKSSDSEAGKDGIAVESPFCDGTDVLFYVGCNRLQNKISDLCMINRKKDV